MVFKVFPGLKSSELKNDMFLHSNENSSVHFKPVPDYNGSICKFALSMAKDLKYISYTAFSDYLWRMIAFAQNS